jgi:serine/threonine protein kinase
MANPLDFQSPSEPAIPVATALPSPCLSDDELLAFAVGRLDAGRLSLAHAHLDACDTCQRLLSEAAHALATAATAPLLEDEDGAWNTMFQPGALVGQRYLIRHFIARGGMGEVYEAFDRDLQERVALKTVTSTACDSPRAVRRLKGEVQLARRVSHPNVCRIYDLGSHQLEKGGAQLHFLTMEFVEGETLGQRVRLAGALPVEEAQKLARELLLGLSAAHAAGILHRDFKSDNVMLRAEADGQSTPLILDFGLARALDQDSRQGASVSNPTLVGTFGYIAPEQIEGKPLSTASDVYSFGVVWFEMLTGELPFEAGSSVAANALERLRRSPPAPSSLNPLVPPEVDALVLRCLRRSSLERFKSAGEVLSALDALQHSPRSGLRSRQLAPLAIAAAFGGLGAYWFAPNDSTPIEPVAVAAAHSASTVPSEVPPSPALRPSSAPREPASKESPLAKRPKPARAKIAARPARSAEAASEPRVEVPGAALDSASANGEVPASEPARAEPAPSTSRPAPELPDWENPFGARPKR